MDLFRFSERQTLLIEFTKIKNCWSADDCMLNLSIKQSKSRLYNTNWLEILMANAKNVTLLSVSYAVSLRASMQPRTIFEDVTETHMHTAETGALHIQRLRLLSHAMLYDDIVGKSSSSYLQTHCEGKTTAQLIVDIVQARDVSRKAYTLFL